MNQPSGKASIRTQRCPDFLQIFFAGHIKRRPYTFMRTSERERTRDAIESHPYLFSEAPALPGLTSSIKRWVVLLCCPSPEDICLPHLPSPLSLSLSLSLSLLA